MVGALLATRPFQHEFIGRGSLLVYLSDVQGDIVVVAVLLDQRGIMRSAISRLELRLRVFMFESHFFLTIFGDASES